MSKIIALFLITVVFTMNMFLSIEAAVKGGKVLSLTGVHDTGILLSLLASVSGMIVCMVLVYIIETQVKWEIPDDK